jgi:acid stress-induced BolA-like protein IbaG/YrbA
MALQILGTGPKPEEVAEKLRGSIAGAMPGAEVEVTCGSAGHFEIRVVSELFEGKNRVQQQQAVYSAIQHLMKGKNPPVHAVDRMRCETP